MSDIDIVNGAECLSWIDKAIGFCNRQNIGATGISNSPFETGYALMKISANSNYMSIGTNVIGMPCRGYIWSHDTNIRKIGVIQNKYDDGGIQVAILGLGDTIRQANIRNFEFSLNYTANVRYISAESSISGKVSYVKDLEHYYNPPQYSIRSVQGSYCNVQDRYSNILVEPNLYYIPFDNALSFSPTINSSGGNRFPNLCDINGLELEEYRDNIGLTNEVRTTVTYGRGINSSYLTGALDMYLDNPLSIISGDLYAYMTDSINDNFGAYDFGGFYNTTQEEINLLFNSINGTEITERGITNYNNVAIPYNLILTESESQALRYLETGELPSDAHLYPMDWENLPFYSGKNPDENDPSDTKPTDDRNVKPNLPEDRSFTPSMLSNINYYWLEAPQLQEFNNWFWYDVGTIEDLGDLWAKIEGLYTDLSQAILGIRYFPVKADWIGGLDNPTSIKLGMLEKSGSYDILSKSNTPIVRDVGSIRINRYNKDFTDFAPYSDIQLYLPFYGFVPLDINIYNDHTLYVKAVYDFLSSTIQYMLYCDNIWMTNSYLAKMGVDIPITLTSKNDRDSAIFQNVFNTMSGLLSGAGSIAGGVTNAVMGNVGGAITQTVAGVESIGGAVGGAIMGGGQATAPIKVFGASGETGALMMNTHPALIVKRSIEQPPSKNAYTSNLGYVTDKEYNLSSLSGFVMCFNPKISFSGILYENDNISGKHFPTTDEIEEIYNSLSKGVIL